MAEKTRHAAAGMMLGQPIGCENKWKPRIAWWREPVFSTCEPIDHRIGVARIERIAHRRFQRLVMRREWAVLQTSRNVHPAQPIFVQDEWRVAALALKTGLVPSRSIIGRFVCLEVRNVDAGPLFRFPPDKFLAFAPRLTIRLRTCAIVDDTAITRPTKAPAVSKIILRFSRVRFVHAVSIENARVNPATAGSRSISFQFVVICDLRTVMSMALSINATKENSVDGTDISAPGYRWRLPSIDLSKDCLHFRLAECVLRIPPVERAQRFVDRIIGSPGFSNQPQGQLMNEPCVGPRITRWIDCFLPPLQKTLRVRERPFFFRMTSRRKEENFRLNLFRFQFTALNLRRIAPKSGWLGFHHVANDKPF